MRTASLPSSVRYVKNGTKGRWWRVAQAENQIHLGWKLIPASLLKSPDYSQIEQLIREEFDTRPGATQDFNALRDALDNPAQHLWITFQAGFMWWCTVSNVVTINPQGEGQQRGHFWLCCDRKWSNRSLAGKLLASADLPGPVVSTRGFKGTICTPAAWETVLRIIHDEKNVEAEHAAEVRENYKAAILSVVKALSWKDFEQLIDLIFSRTGWARVSTLTPSNEGVDLEVENLTAGELAFVQIKASASQSVLNDYVARFEQQRERYARMVFAVHSPTGKIQSPANTAVQVWTGEKVADLVVRLGLGEWVEHRLG